MAEKEINSLVSSLMLELEKRGVKIPQFAKEADIPKDRVYKWVQEGTNPKADDIDKIRLWLGLEKVPQGTSELYERLLKKEEARRQEAWDLVNSLKEDKAELFAVIKRNQETLDSVLVKIAANLNQNQMNLEFLKGQADMVIKQLARRDAALLEAMGKIPRGSQSGKVKGAKGNHNEKRGSKH